MFIIFTRVFSVFILIFIGFFACKIKILPGESTKYLINLMLYITAPCMAASSIYTKELSPQVINATIQVLVGATIYFAISTVIAFAAVKFLKFKPKAEWGLYIAAICCINSGFMGFPVTKAIFGEDIFYLMVIHNIISCGYIYGVTPVLIDMGKENHSSRLSALKSMINPCTIGILIGVVMLLIGVRPPDSLDQMIISLSDATIPISMIIVGIQLAGSDFKNMLKDKYINIVNILSMMIIPVLTFLIVDQIDILEPNVKLILIFASVFPTAVAPAAIAEQRGVPAGKLAEIVSVTTATSLVIIPIMAMVLMKVYL